MSPLKYYQGTIKPASTAWVCPSCKQENLGALEAGCAHCSAGKDAGKAQRIEATSTPPAADPFEWWIAKTCGAGWHELKPPAHTDDLLHMYRKAFAAGVDWARENLGTPASNATEGVGGNVRPEAATTGGWGLTMVHSDPATWGDPAHMASPLDARAVHTVLAALAFYRDNQLAYGAVPGQLDAQEVSKLIEQLSPQEPA